MKTLLICASLLTCALVQAGVQELPTDISLQDKPQTIKVLIDRAQDKVLLEVKGRYYVYNPENSLLISSGVFSKRAHIQATADGLKWKELFPSIHQIRIVPGDSHSSILVNGIEYKGCVEIYGMNHHLNIVNEVDIERYLKSTLSAQFDNKFDENVIEALTVVARTNAYYLATRKSDAHWHVDAQEVLYQGYAASLQNLAVDKAIETTKNYVMTYKNAPFAATWTADSAGKTADLATVTRKKLSGPKGVSAPLAAKDREKHTWTFTMNKAQLASLIDFPEITGIDVYQDQDSGKVYGVKINGSVDEGSFDFVKFQKLIGAQKLRSNDFTVAVQDDQIVFKGFGEGLGAGLCLYSANLMAKKGQNAKQILASFFPSTKLTSFNEKPAEIEKK